MGLSWVSHSTLIYTSELILCSHICVYSATRHNIHMISNTVSHLEVFRCEIIIKAKQKESFKFLPVIKVKNTWQQIKKHFGNKNREGNTENTVFRKLHCIRIKNETTLPNSHSFFNICRSHLITKIHHKLGKLFDIYHILCIICVCIDDLCTSCNLVKRPEQ